LLLSERAIDPSISARLDPRLVEKKARLDLLRPLPPAVVQRLTDDMGPATIRVSNSHRT